MAKSAKETPRERALRTKPWLKSTGPTSAEGKAKSALRAYKHGLRAAGNRARIAWIRSVMRLAEALQ